MQSRRSVPMLGGVAADVLIAPEQYISFRRLTGDEAVEAGLPAVFNPEIAVGEYIAAYGETPESFDWQGTWLDTGSTLIIHRTQMKAGLAFTGHSIDPVEMVADTLLGRSDVKRYRVRRTGGLSIWGGNLEWAYAAAPIRPEGSPKGRTHCIAFSWLCSSKWAEAIGVYQLNLPGRSSAPVERFLSELIIGGDMRAT